MPQKKNKGVDATLTRNGGLSYLEIPAKNLSKSAAFYEKVVGWKLDWRSKTDVRFADATGHLIGRWRKDRPAAPKRGFLPYIYVNRINRATKSANALGGKVLKAPFVEGDLWVAMVRDPAGNVLGLWQEQSR